MESVIATREEVEHFLSTQQQIFSYSDGSDYNYGDGYGYGDGFSSGTDNGSGCSWGRYEYSNGYGYGYGNGSGAGYSSGYGGDGYSYSDKDIKALNGNLVDYVDDLPTIITQVRGNIACGYFIKADLTLNSCFIAKAGNSFAHGYTLKEAVTDAETKELENMPIEERIEKFIEVFGSLDSKHTGKEFYDWHNILTGSCRMGRDEFCKTHDIDLEKKYTVKYFLDITKESYGRDIIKLIRKEYEKMEK